MFTGPHLNTSGAGRISKPAPAVEAFITLSNSPSLQVLIQFVVIFLFSLKYVLNKILTLSSSNREVEEVSFDDLSPDAQVNSILKHGNEDTVNSPVI